MRSHTLHFLSLCFIFFFIQVFSIFSGIGDDEDWIIVEGDASVDIVNHEESIQTPFEIWSNCSTTSCSKPGQKDLEYSLLTREWRIMRGDTNNGTNRYSQAGFHDNNDPAGRALASFWMGENENSFFLFGGKNGLTGVIDNYNDVWEYNMEDNMWRRILDIDLAGCQYGNDYDTANQPPGMNAQSIVKPSNTSKYMYMFGGRKEGLSSSDYFNDIFVYKSDIESFKWLKGNKTANPIGDYGPKGVELISNLPPGRSASMIWYLDDEIYMFGGYYKEPVPFLDIYSFSDFWKYTISSNNWIFIAGNIGYNRTNFTVESFITRDTRNFPPSLHGAFSWVIDDTLFMFGGTAMFFTRATPIHFKRPKSNLLWSWKETEGWGVESGQIAHFWGATIPILEPKSHLTGAVDSYNRVWIFGGEGPYDGTNQLTMFKKYQTIECGGAGKMDMGVCDCDLDGYFGDMCDDWTCYGIQKDHEDVCSNQFGICIDYDDCTRWKCFDVESTSPDICGGGNGLCERPDNCTCNDYNEWEGQNCSIPLCYGEDAIKPWCNNGNGSCDLTTDPHTCICDSTYYGIKCQERLTNVSLSDDHLYIIWEIAESLVTSADCSTFNPYILNVQNISSFGEGVAFCGFKKLDDDYTHFSYLDVNLGPNYTVSIGDVITVYPYTRVDLAESVSFVVNGDKPPGSGPVNPIITPYDPTDLIIIISICVAVVLLLVCLALIVTGVVLFFVVLRNKRLAKKQKKAFGTLHNLSERELQNILAETFGGEDDKSMANIKINKKLFEINYEDLRVERKIGAGGSDSVIFKAEWKGKIIAFKCFKTQDICTSQDNFDEFEKEVSILSSISHPNILTFYGCCLKPPRVGIVMEFCPHGELMDYVMKKKLTFPNKLDLLLGIARGMDYLHERNVIHRDLKSQNVLLGENLQPKIIDFGISRIVDDMNVDKTRRIGTGYYMAPEVVMGTTYDEKCDVFSYSIVMFEVLSGKLHPYGEETKFNVEVKVATDKDFRPNTMELEMGVSQLWIVVLMTQCWSHDPKDRPSFHSICNTLQKKVNALGGVKTKRKFSISLDEGQRKEITSQRDAMKKDKEDKKDGGVEEKKK